MGHRGELHVAVVGREQRHKDVHALQRRRPAVPAAAHRPARREPRRRSDRDRFNGGTQFVVSAAGKSGPALFLFATEAGTILGWSPAVDPTTAIQGVATPGAVYKGLAIAGSTIYATDFHNGRVDVFDGSFHPVKTPGAFTDPKLPQDFAPFGIQNIGGNIFVTYAKQAPEGDDEVAGPRLGVVDEYDATGRLLQRVAKGGRLNAPWGLAMAPESFGKAGGDLLVGNFGDGRINAFRMKHDGRFEPDGRLRGTDHRPISIDGLWGIGFGNGANPDRSTRSTSPPDPMTRTTASSASSR